MKSSYLKKTVFFCLVVTVMFIVVMSMSTIASAATISVSTLPDGVTTPTTTTAGSISGVIIGNTGASEVTMAVYLASDVDISTLYSIDQVTSDASGNFTIGNIWLLPEALSGEYVIKVGGTDVDTPWSQTFTYGEATGYTVSGYVYAEVGGSTTTATVTIVDTSYSAIADVDGSFTIANVPAGTYDLAISKKGALTRTISIGALSADYVVSLVTNKISLFIGDGNADGSINNDDLMGVKNCFLKTPGDSGYDALYDVNNDNSINNDDLMAVKATFLKTPVDYPVWEK